MTYHRLAMLLFCCLTGAFAATAAPAPVYNPKRSKIWIDGWEKPTDPAGDCRFDRAGEKLIIAIPGNGLPRGLAVGQGRSTNAPRLIRDVAGDFDARVRVTGVFAPGRGRDDFCSAGILLADAGGTIVVKVQAAVIGGGDYISLVGESFGLTGTTTITHHLHDSTGKGEVVDDKGPDGRPPYLRMERRGDIVRMSFSHDGREWKRILLPPSRVKLLRRLKVGVVAETTATTPFRPAFDRFSLTSLK